MELKDITAVITGASGELGSQIALSLAHAGCNCVCHYNRNRQRCEELVRRIEKMGVNALAISADLTDPAHIDKLFAEAGGLGTPGILINSAAVFSSQALDKVTFEQAQEVLNLNLTAAIMTSRAFAKSINDKSGKQGSTIAKIINISDIGGIRPWAKYVLYCSAKAGLIGATKALAKELAPWICVNSVAPGLVTWPEDFTQEQKQQQLKLVPLRRIAEPADITAAIIFLLKNDYITGQVLNVDGGRCI